MLKCFDKTKLFIEIKIPFQIEMKTGHSGVLPDRINPLKNQWHYSVRQLRKRKVLSLISNFNLHFLMFSFSVFIRLSYFHPGQSTIMEERLQIISMAAVPKMWTFFTCVPLPLCFFESVCIVQVPLFIVLLFQMIAPFL